MKKFLLLFCLLLPVFTLHARGIQEDIRKAEEKAQVSYAIGMLMGTNLATFPLEIDFDAFTQGMRDMLTEGIEPQYSEREAVEIVETAVQRAMDRLIVEYRQAEIEFLEQNMQRPEVSVTQSGLQFEVLAESEGIRPNPNSVVRVLYTGTFIDGTLFDSSEEEGAYIPLNMVIPGWAEGVMLMTEGSKYRFFIPSALAYGSEGMHPIIPPYSVLIFTVELLEVIQDETLTDFFDQLQQEMEIIEGLD